MPDRLSGPALRRGAGIVLLCLAVAIVAGLVWHAVWEPPSGYVVEGQACGADGGSCWVPMPPETARTAEFDGTALYVLVCLAAGLATGLAVALWSRAEMVSLIALLLGSALAALVTARVGALLGPSDPESLLSSAEVGSRLPGDLEVVGPTPYLVWPIAALLAMAVVFVVLPHRLPTGSPRTASPPPPPG